jgi:hypothetical protein
MTTIRRLRTEQGFIYSPASINAAMEAMARDIAAAVTGDSFETYVANQPWLVVEGLEIYSEGDNDIAMTPGVAVGKTSGSPQMIAIWQGIEAFAGSLPAPDGDDPRIDAVCLVITDADLATSTQAQVGGVPASVATQRGASAVLTIVEGVAAPSPVAPAIPSGALLLSYCFTETDGTVTILDKRPFATTARKRISTMRPIEFYADYAEALDPFASLMSIKRRSFTFDGLGPTPAPFESQFGWDMDLNMPVFYKDPAFPVSDATSGNHYPMLIPGGMTYQITKPVTRMTPAYWFGEALGSPPLEVNNTDATDSHLVINSNHSGADEMTFSIPVEAQIRGWELGNAGIVFSNSAFTNTTLTVKLQHRAHVATSWTDVASKAFALSSTFAAQEWAVNTTVTPALATGCIRFLINVAKTSGASGGVLNIRGVTFAPIEGRT